MILKNLIFKWVLIIAIGVTVVIVYWGADGARRLQLFALANSNLTAPEILEVFRMTSADACADNKYNLPEDECINLILTKGPHCTQAAGDKFPGRLNNVEKIMMLGTFFNSCVFESKRN